MRKNNFLSLSSVLRDRMIEHALKDAPNECCGVLLGRNGVAERVIAMKSDLPAPDAYFMNPEQQVEVFTDMAKRGEELVGIYHSHPKGPAEPSAADLQLAFHPEVVYCIISLADAANPEARAFMLHNGRFDEVPLSIT